MFLCGLSLGSIKKEVQVQNGRVTIVDSFSISQK